MAKSNSRYFRLSSIANLQPGGKNLDVTINNVDEYVDLVVEFTIGRGIRRQIGEFKKGFSSVFPYEALCAFTADELVMLFGKSDEDWTYESTTPSIDFTNRSSCGLCQS